MKHGKRRFVAVLMDERECGAGNFVPMGDAQAFHDAFSESGLARAEVANQEHDARELAAERAAKLDGFVGGISAKGG